MPELTQQSIRSLTRSNRRPRDGSRIEFNQSDRTRLMEQSTGITPGQLGAILADANEGRNEDQSKLSQEIMEKDGDIFTSYAVRRAQLISTPWKVCPPKDLPKAQQAGAEIIANEIELELRAISGNRDKQIAGFEQYLEDMFSALLPAFSVHEIIWKDGGAGIFGFKFIPQFYFNFVDSFSPMLKTDGFPNGRMLETNKYSVHYMRARSGDVPRAGLIRPLAWYYLFKNMGLKDLLRYSELYGIPSLVAKIPQEDFDKMKWEIFDKLKNMGSDGVTVVTDDTEIDTATPPNLEGSLYFKMLDFFKTEVTQIILGQTGTTSGENSNRSTAEVHERQLQKLRAGDAHKFQTTINDELIQPMCLFRYGPNAIKPLFEFDIEDIDKVEMSTVLKTLNEAGYEVEDVEDLNQKFGMRLRRTQAVDQNPIVKQDSDNALALSAGSDQNYSYTEEIKNVDEFRILKKGKWQHTKDDGVTVIHELNDDNMQSIMDNFKEKGVELPIDCEHVILNKAMKLGLTESEYLKTLPEGINPAAGFFEPVIKEDGLYVRIKNLNEDVREFIKEGAIKYFSPVFRGIGTKNLALSSFTFTNRPAIDQLDALALSMVIDDGKNEGLNREGAIKVNELLKKLLLALAAVSGNDVTALSATITDEELSEDAVKEVEAFIEEAASSTKGVKELQEQLDAVKEGNDTSEKLLVDLREQLGLEKDATIDVIQSALKGLVESKTVDQKAVVALTAKVEGMEKETETANRDKEIDKLTKAGQLTDAQKEWAESQSALALSAYGKTAPVNAALAGDSTETPAGDPELNPTEKADPKIAAMFGNKVEDIQKIIDEDK